MTTTRLTKPKAIVVGGSLGGLLAANMLMRDGWDVEIFERTPEAWSDAAPASSRIRSCSRRSPPPAWRSTTASACTWTGASRCRAGQGLVGTRHAADADRLGQIYEVLNHAFTGTYRTGATVVSADTHGDHAVVTLQDGSAHRADLVVAADGFRSGLREQWLPAAGLEYAGYIARRGTVDEAQLSAGTRADIFEQFAFCLPPHEQILGYPWPAPPAAPRRASAATTSCGTAPRADDDFPTC